MPRLISLSAARCSKVPSSRSARTHLAHAAAARRGRGAGTGPIRIPDGLAGLLRPRIRHRRRRHEPRSPIEQPAARGSPSPPYFRREQPRKLVREPGFSSRPGERRRAPQREDPASSSNRRNHSELAPGQPQVFLRRHSIPKIDKTRRFRRTARIYRVSQNLQSASSEGQAGPSNSTAGQQNFRAPGRSSDGPSKTFQPAEFMEPRRTFRTASKIVSPHRIARAEHRAC